MLGFTRPLTAQSIPTAIGLADQRVGGYTGLPTLVAQFGIDPVEVLTSAGLAADALASAESRVPYAALGKLLGECAARTRCAHFGLLAGRIWRVADFGLPGMLAHNAPTLGEALELLTVHQHLNSGGGLAFLIDHGMTVDLGYAIYYPGVSGADQLCDAALAGGMNILRELIGEAAVPSEVLISRAKPLDTAPYLNQFKVPPRFNADYCTLRFPSRWLAKKVKGANPERLRRAEQQAAMMEHAQLMQQIYRALRVLMIRGTPSGDAVAQMLAMHRRTLNRRLQDAGTTFQDVLDQLRFEVARQLLSGCEISLDEVSATLGYASVSPFMRAFRRWTDATPNQWRRSILAQDRQHVRGRN